MSFEKTPPIWNNAGQEPSLELQENGFTAGYKPPAPYFNYLFHQNTECLKELQEKVAEKENVNAEFAKRNITTYTLLHQIGITIGTETIQSLAQKIPMNSILTYSVSANYKDDTYPDYGEQDRNGVMEVIRGASTNVFFRFTRSANADKDARMWVGNWGSTTGWSGWKEVAYVTNGTLTSDNSDFAEVGEWSDGNPDSEDRLGYFVCVSKTEIGITMTKATADSDVRGVTIASPAFAANASRDKYGEDGNLLNQYNYVAFAGFATVIDNGTCTVNGRCMPDDNGCAVPSSNTMGYQVIERVDDTHILILVEPNSDMLNRIKDDIDDLEENKANKVHTHNYAGSSSAGGSATSAEKLTKSDGNATKPVYFENGVPKACTYELNKTVPEDAVFTDTTYKVRTSMVDLGFTNNSTYTVVEFLEKLIEKGYVGQILVEFVYANARTAKVSDGTTTIDMNGVSCFVNLSSGAYRRIYASVLANRKQYLMCAQYDSDASTPSNQGIIDVSSTVATSCTGNSKTASGLNIYATEPIKSTSDDTYENWIKLPGCSVSWYNNNYLNKQPSRYGFLLSLTGGNKDVHQLWFTQIGSIYRRAGNSSGLKDWYEMLDSGNYSDYATKSISDKWDSTKTYYTGDYCIENNQLWKCKGMNTGAEPSGSIGSTYWDKVTIASELNSKANTGYKKLLTIPKGSINYQASTTYTLSTGKLSYYSSILLVDHNNSYSTVPLPIFENGSKVNVGTGDVEVKYSSDTKIVVSISGESAGNYGLTVYGL